MNAQPNGEGISLHAEDLIALRHLVRLREKTPVLTALPGGFTTRRKGAGQEFADIRNYIAGDDLRHLDRGSTARTGKLHIRQFKEERDRVVMLVADFRPCMFWGISRALRSVAAAEALALIGWRSIEDGARVGVFAIGPDQTTIVPPRGRTRGMLDCIGGLVTAHDHAIQTITAGQRDNLPLDRNFERIARVCPNGAEMFIASGFDETGNTFQDVMNRVARRRTPRLLLITDGTSGRMPKGRYPVKLANGLRVNVVLGGQSGPLHKAATMIVGHPVTEVSASAEPETIARRLAHELGEGAGK